MLLDTVGCIPHLYWGSHSLVVGCAVTPQGLDSFFFPFSSRKTFLDSPFDFIHLFSSMWS